MANFTCQLQLLKRVPVTLSLGMSECSFWIRSVFGSLDSTSMGQQYPAAMGLNGTRVEEGGSSFSDDVWDLVSSCSCVDSQQLFWVSSLQTTDYGHNQESPCMCVHKCASFLLVLFLCITLNTVTNTGQEFWRQCLKRIANDHSIV